VFCQNLIRYEYEMREINKYGLSRYIDAETRRKIRQECGFGCISCGSAIYQYEHIIPEFKDATKHESDKIGLLCGRCHDNVTRGIWSKTSIQEQRKNPFPLKTKTSKFNFLLDPNSTVIFRLGNATFSGTSVIIVIDSNPILSVFPPEEVESPPLIKAQFYDREGNRIAWIDDNEWNGSSDSFDIEAKGNSIKVRSAQYNIDLHIKIIPPGIFEIQTLNLIYNGKSIDGNKRDGFQVRSTNTSITIGREKQEIVNPPFGISIQGETIYIGSNDIANFQDLQGKTPKISGHFEIKGGELDLEYGDSPYPKMRFMSKSDGAGFGIRLNLPTTDQPRRTLRFQKQERNERCNCGKNAKYKKCCLLNKQNLTDIINDPAIINISNEIFTAFDVTEIQYRFDYQPTKLRSWLHLSESHPIVIINTSKAFSRNNVGYSLVAWKLVQEGYGYELDLYQDLRHNITCDLQDILLGIPVIDRLKLEGFELSRHFEDDVKVISEIIAKKVPNDSDSQVSGVSILESVKMIRLDYNVDFLTSDEKNRIIENFRIKSPIAVKIYNELTKMINPGETYSKEGYNLLLHRCVMYLDIISAGKFSEYVKLITT